MLKDLSFGEPQGVAPKKLERKVEALPRPVALAYDKTPLGEARTLPVAVSLAARVELGAAEKVGARLVSLLKKYARESPAGAPTIPFKAGFTVTDEGITLYWQKKPAKPARDIGPLPGSARDIAILGGDPSMAFVEKGGRDKLADVYHHVTKLEAEPEPVPEKTKKGGKG